ncbi:MAG: hypothetical protein RLZZ127_690 [Planctomycetota bacterium]|jgi:hypothetical protein
MSRILLPLLASAGAAIAAADPESRLVIGGHVAGTASLDGYGQAHPRHPGGREAGETALDAEFSGQALVFLQARYDRFALRTDLALDGDPQFQSVDAGGDLDQGDPLVLEQAFVDWTATDLLTVRAGRFRTTWLGWEAFLPRARHSAAWDWNVQNHSLGPNQPFVTDGVGVLLGASGRWGVEGYVADQVLGSTGDKSGTDLATGISLWAQDPSLGRIELGAAHDPRSTSGPGGAGVHAVAVDLNADLRAFQAQGWFFAAQVQWHHHPDLVVGGERWGSDLVLLGMANYAFSPNTSVTLMVDHVERGFEAGSNEVLEVAVALLLRPHPRARFHLEVNAQDESADDADAVGAAAVVMVDLP